MSGSDLKKVSFEGFLLFSFWQMSCHVVTLPFTCDMMDVEAVCSKVEMINTACCLWKSKSIGMHFQSARTRRALQNVISRLFEWESEDVPRVRTNKCELYKYKNSKCYWKCQNNTGGEVVTAVPTLAHTQVMCLLHNDTEIQ